MALHLECVPEHAQRLAATLFPATEDLGFVLAGGTGLALQFGHRISVDFDLFAPPEKYPGRPLDRVRRAADALQVIQDKHDTLDVLLDRVKCSFFSYPYPFSAFAGRFHGVALADALDIAAMKLVAISRRGARKDFIDLYVCLRRHSFEAVFANALHRFGRDSMNPLHIGKSLAYFADAENDPDPPFAGESVRWASVEEFFRAHARSSVEHMTAAARRSIRARRDRVLTWRECGHPSPGLPFTTRGSCGPGRGTVSGRRRLRH